MTNEALFLKQIVHQRSECIIFMFVYMFRIYTSDLTLVILDTVQDVQVDNQRFLFISNCQ